MCSYYCTLPVCVPAVLGALAVWRQNKTKKIFIHVPCFLMCIMFYFSFIWLHVYAFPIHSMVHDWNAFEPGASELPYYCTPPVCVPAVLGALAVWRQNTQKNKRSDLFHPLVGDLSGTALYTKVRCTSHLPPGGWPTARWRVYHWPWLSPHMITMTQTTEAPYAGMQQHGKALDMLLWHIQHDTIRRQQICPYPCTCTVFCSHIAFGAWFGINVLMQSMHSAAPPFYHMYAQHCMTPHHTHSTQPGCHETL